MDKIVIVGFKNRFNTTIKQLYIDYGRKTYKIGNFTTRNDKRLTKKAFYEKIEELKVLGFSEE